MMAQQSKKFTFNKSLDDATYQDRLSYAATMQLKSELEDKPVVYSENELASEKKKSFDEGYQDALNSIEAESSKTLMLLGDQLERVIAYEEQQKEDFEAHSIAFSGHLFHKFFPEILASHEASIIENYIKEHLHELIEKPKLQFTFSETVLSIMKDKIEVLLKERGYEGHFLVQGDENLGALECGIDWINGGVKKRISHLWETFYTAFPAAKRETANAIENNNMNQQEIDIETSKKNDIETNEEIKENE